jgi:hypothetical protein
VSEEVCGGELSPPVPADAVRGRTSESSRKLVTAGVDGTDRDALACLVDGEAQVAVVGNDDSGVDGAVEDVEWGLVREERGDLFGRGGVGEVPALGAVAAHGLLAAIGAEELTLPGPEPMRRVRAERHA